MMVATIRKRDIGIDQAAARMVGVVRL